MCHEGKEATNFLLPSQLLLATIFSSGRMLDTFSLCSNMLLQSANPACRQHVCSHQKVMPFSGKTLDLGMNFSHSVFSCILFIYPKFKPPLCPCSIVLLISLWTTSCTDFKEKASNISLCFKPPGVPRRWSYKHTIHDNFIMMSKKSPIRVHLKLVKIP